MDSFAWEYLDKRNEGENSPLLDLQQEAGQSWERANKEFPNPNGINPYAYVLGYKAAAKKLMPLIEQLQRDNESMNKSLREIGEKNIKKIFQPPQ